MWETYGEALSKKEVKAKPLPGLFFEISKEDLPLEANIALYSSIFKKPLG